MPKKTKSIQAMTKEEADEQFQNILPFYDLHELQELGNIRAMFCGGSECGKSWVLNYILRHVLKVDVKNQVILFCPTTSSERNRYYGDIKHKYSEFSIKVVENLISYQTYKQKQGLDLNEYYLIVDDVLDMSSTQFFSNLFRSCSHYHINIFFLLQHPSILKTNIARSNTNLTFIFREENNNTLEIYANCFGGKLGDKIMTNGDFIKMLDKNTEIPYSFLVRVKGQSSRFYFYRCLAPSPDEIDK